MPSCKVDWKSSYGNRILDAKWDMHKLMYFDAIIEIRGIDRKGILQDVAEIDIFSHESKYPQGYYQQ